MQREKGPLKKGDDSVGIVREASTQRSPARRWWWGVWCAVGSVCSVWCVRCVVCAVCGVRCVVCGVQCAVCGLRFAVCSVRFAVCGLQYAVCAVCVCVRVCVRGGKSGKSGKAAGCHSTMRVAGVTCQLKRPMQTSGPTSSSSHLLATPNSTLDDKPSLPPPTAHKLRKTYTHHAFGMLPFCSLCFLRAKALNSLFGGSLAHPATPASFGPAALFASSSSSATLPHVFSSCLLLQPPPHSTPPFRNTRCNTGKCLMSLCSRTRLIVRNASSTPSSPPCQLCQPAVSLSPCLRIHFDAAFQFSQNPSNRRSRLYLSHLLHAPGASFPIPARGRSLRHARSPSISPSVSRPCRNSALSSPRGRPMSSMSWLSVSL